MTEAELLDRERFNRVDTKLDRILKLAIVVTDIARIDARIDGVEKRLGRIEKRLELADA